jgi:hypothetical protein
MSKALEHIRMRCPKLQVSCGCTTAMPKPQGSGYQLRRFQSHLGIRRINIADFVGRILPPPRSELAKSTLCLIAKLLHVARSGLSPDPRQQPKTHLHDFDKFMDSIVWNRGVRAAKAIEVTCESENVPRVDQRAACDTSANKIVDLLRDL